MDSVTKFRQSPAVLRRMVERAYGIHLVPDSGGEWFRELNFGMFNATYRVQLRDGAKVVLKIAPAPDVEVMTYEVGAMATELLALGLIRERTTVPVPSVHFADSSHEVCGADYFFMDFIDGDNLAVIEESLSAPVRLGYRESLGAANRELNSVRGDAFGPLAAATDRTWRAAFGRMVDDVLGDGERRQVDIGWDYDLVREVVETNVASLDEVVEPQLVEWDLWNGNVLVQRGRIVGIVDHERAFWGDPLIEHGFIGLTLPAFGDPAAFSRGYGRPSLTENELTRRRLYGVHLMLIMIIETAYRNYVDPQPFSWARIQLDEVMSQLGLTPRR